MGLFNKLFGENSKEDKAKDHFKKYNYLILEL